MLKVLERPQDDLRILKWAWSFGSFLCVAGWSKESSRALPVWRRVISDGNWKEI